MNAALKMKTVYIGILYLICIAAVKGEESQTDVSSKTDPAGNVRISTESGEGASAAHLVAINSNTSLLHEGIESQNNTKINQTNSLNASSTKTQLELSSTNSFVSESVTGDNLVSITKEVSDASTEKTIFASSDTNEYITTTLTPNPGFTAVSTSSNISSVQSEQTTHTMMETDSSNQNETSTSNISISQSTDFSSSMSTNTGTTESTAITSKSSTILVPSSSKSSPTIKTSTASDAINTQSSSSSKNVDVSSSSVTPLNLTSTPLNTLDVVSTSSPTLKSSEAPVDIFSTLPLPKTSIDASATTKGKTPGVITVTFSPSSSLTSNIASETPTPLLTIAGNRALKLTVSITFLVIAVVATAVLLVYMIRIKRRTVLYDELRLLP